MANDTGLYGKYDALLKERGVSTYEVCKATAIDPATMSNWKHGNYTPKVDKLARIADYFDVPITFFIE